MQQHKIRNILRDYNDDLFFWTGETSNYVCTLGPFILLSTKKAHFTQLIFFRQRDTHTPITHPFASRKRLSPAATLCLAPRAFPPAEKVFEILGREHTCPRVYKRLRWVKNIEGKSVFLAPGGTKSSISQGGWGVAGGGTIHTQ